MVVKNKREEGGDGGENMRKEGGDGDEKHATGRRWWW